MKLTIKAIIRWELLNGKPFSEIEYNNENELLSILYLCFLSNNTSIPFEDFKEDLTDESLKQMIEEYQKEVLFFSQFQNREKKEESESENTTSKIFIKDIVSMLIMNGLDAHFAFNEMSLSDLPLLVEAYDNERKIRLEYERLWTFFNVSPYLSKGATPNSLFPFDWEKKDEPEIKKNTLEEDIALYEAFMNSGKELNKNE